MITSRKAKVGDIPSLIELRMEVLNGEEQLVAFFNTLVKRPDFKSFFIDEMMAHYKTKIADLLKVKEKQCIEEFMALEKTCKNFGESWVWILTMRASGSLGRFSSAINEWDRISFCSCFYYTSSVILVQLFREGARLTSKSAVTTAVNEINGLYW